MSRIKFSWIVIRKYSENYSEIEANAQLRL